MRRQALVLPEKPKSLVFPAKTTTVSIRVVRTRGPRVKEYKAFPPSSAMRIQKSEDSKLSAVSSQHSVLIALSFALCLKARRAAPNDLNERNVLNDPNDPNQPNQFNQSN